MSINKFIKVEDEKYLYRDSNSKAVVNTNATALKEYKESKAKRSEKNSQILQYQDDINTLKDEVTDIKNSLKQLLDALNSKG
jgi:chromosome segregation ATPase